MNYTAYAVRGVLAIVSKACTKMFQTVPLHSSSSTPSSPMKNELFRCYFCNMADNDAEFPGKSESAPGLNYAVMVFLC